MLSILFHIVLILFKSADLWSTVKYFASPLRIILMNEHNAHKTLTPNTYMNHVMLQY